ncbi:MAG: hypothetical protein Q9211_000250 [Gyalolechia sp. 1 TL-2023]
MPEIPRSKDDAGRFHEEDPVLVDMVCAMDNVGRSQSQYSLSCPIKEYTRLNLYQRQLLDLANTTKNQAANESRFQISAFESRANACRDDIVSHVKEITDQIQRETDIRALTASMLLTGEATGSRQREYSSTKSMEQLVTESILDLFKRFLDQYDGAERKESTNGRSLPKKPRRRDEVFLDELLRSQHERVRQRVSTLLHGRTHLSSEIPGELLVRLESDNIWSSLTAELNDGAGNINEQERYSWNRINKSARRGVRRLVNHLPEGSETEDVQN